MQIRDALTAILFAIGTVSVAAAEPDKPADSPFSRDAQTIRDLHEATLRADLAAERRKAGDGEAPHAASESTVERPKRVPLAVVEIGGAGGRYIATIRLPDGELIDVASGQAVNGLGRVTVGADGVRDDHGHLHNISER